MTPRWIHPGLVLAVLQLSLASFLGGTFQTAPLCVACVTLTIVLVILLQDRSASQKRLAEANPKQRSWKRKLLRGATLMTALIGAVFFAFTWRFAPAIEDTRNILMVVVDTVGHTAIILSCVLWVFWPTRGHVMMLVLGMVTILMAVAGGGLSTTLTAQTALGLSVCVGFVLASHTILQGQSIAGTTSHWMIRSGATEPLFGGWFYRLVTLSVMLIVASAVTQLTLRFLPDVQAGVMSQLNERLESNTSPGWGGGGYVNGSQLGNVRDSILTDPAEVALRGLSEAEPGYLRGSVFDLYSRGTWRTTRKWVYQSANAAETNRRQVADARSLPKDGPAVTPLRVPEKLLRTRYSLRFGDASDSLDPDINVFNWNGFSGQDLGGGEFVGIIEIHGEPRRGRRIFLPAAARWLEAAGDRAGITPHGLVANGADARWPWTVGVQERPPAETLADMDRETLLRIDTPIEPMIRSMARNLIGSTQSSSAIAAKVANFFQTEFDYSLAPVSVPAGRDPLVHFLRTRHASHCELFASATALMLRSVGIPTRYVTGYVMDELDEDGDFYLARNRDAHAWVEYFDDDRSRWLPVESTPGRRFSTLEIAQQTDLDLGDSAGAVANDEDSTGWFGPLGRWWSSIRTTDTLVAIFRWSQIPLLLFLLATLWFRGRAQVTDHHELQRILQRRKMDRRMRRLGWVRSPNETLHQFAKRLQNASTQNGHRDELLNAAAWYRQHAVQCYRKSNDDEATVNSPVASVRT